MPALASALLPFALWMVDPRADKVDVSGGATIELRGGFAPVTPTPTAESEPSFLMILTPNVDFETVHRSRGSFTMGYSPRVQWRLPNRLSIDRPLLLHQGYLSYGVGITRRLSLLVDVGGSAGELDYTGIQIALGEGQAETPETDVAQFAVGNASFEIRVLPTRLDEVRFIPSFDIRAPLGETREQNDVTGGFPQQITFDLTSSYRRTLTRLDDLELTVIPGMVDYDFETTFASLEGRLAWLRTISLPTSVRLEAGVFAANLWRSVDSRREGDWKVFPVGSFTILGRLSASATHQLDGTLGVGVVSFFDRVSEVVEPRAYASLGLAATIPPRWLASINASMYTAATKEPRTRTNVGFELFDVPETVIQAQTPFTYTIDDQTRFEFGTVFSVRGSHFASEDFDFSQFEAWLYVAARVGGSTARGRLELGERSSGSIGVGTGGLRAQSGGR